MTVIYVTLLLALSAPLSAATSQEPARRSIVRRMEQPHLSPEGILLEQLVDPAGAEGGAAGGGAAGGGAAGGGAAGGGAAGGAGGNNPGEKGQKVEAMACGMYEDSTEQCNIAFEYGNENNSTCIHEDEKLICTPAICEQAAIEAGLDIIHHNNQTMRDEFQIPPDFFDVYPKGCFRHPCGENGEKHCLFFNGDGDNPSNPVGFPVCSKARYLFGKNDTASTDDDQCPEGYLRIDDGTECDGARQCMGLSPAAPFTIRNGGLTSDFQLPPVGGNDHGVIDRMNYPDGCFFKEDSTIEGGLVWFNPHDANDVPSHPKGTPICRHPNELELKDVHTSGDASAANGHR